MRTITSFRRPSIVFRPGFLAFLLFGCFALLIGCGGGGGGGGTSGGGCDTGTRPSSLNYSTSWSNAAGAGQSQIITILDSDGNVRATKLLNKAQGTSTSLNGFNSGTYDVRIELYENPDALGGKIGEVRAVINFCGQESFQTVTEGQVNGVQVTPATATFTVQESVQFRAYATSNGKATFKNTADFTWESLGQQASVDDNGLVVGLQQGNTTIRARYEPTGDVGGAPITVNPFQTRQTKWTVLVYINAANDLYEFSDLNVNQMEKVAYNPDVRFVVQWKQSKTAWPNSTFDGTRRMVLKSDTSDSIVSPVVQNMGTDIDMGDPLTLRNFITWGKAFYPADRYCLVVWNHGNGWRRSPGDFSSRAFSYDDDTGNAIQIWELQQALANDKFDIFAWDCSLMQMLECAYQLKDNALYVAGSEESPPGEGYPYDAVFKRFADNPNDTSRNLSKGFVDAMINNPPYVNRKITQSVLDTSKLADLAGSLNNYAQQLIANQATIASQVQFARNNAQAFSPTAGRYYRDLKSITTNLEAAPGGVPQGLITAGASLRAAADAAIVWEAHNANSPRSTGIAIDFSPANRFTQFAQDYSLMSLGQATQWDEWLAVAP